MEERILILSEKVAQRAHDLNEESDEPPSQPCMDSMYYSEDYDEIISINNDRTGDEMHVDENMQIPNQLSQEVVLNDEKQVEDEEQDNDKEQISNQLNSEQAQEESSEKEKMINPSKKIKAENSSIPFELHTPSVILPQRADEKCIKPKEMDIDDHNFRKFSLSFYLDPYLDTNSINEFAGNHNKTMLQKELMDITSGDIPNFASVQDATQQNMEKEPHELVFERLGIG